MTCDILAIDKGLGKAMVGEFRVKIDKSGDSLGVFDAEQKLTLACKPLTTPDYTYYRSPMSLCHLQLINLLSKYVIEGLKACGYDCGILEIEFMASNVGETPRRQCKSNLLVTP